jgi:hypothetical protein
MSDSSGLDPLLAVSPDDLLSDGVNLQEMGDKARAACRVLDDVFGAYPVKEGFGEDMDDGIAASLWENVWPPLVNCYKIINQFEGVLKVVGQNTGLVGSTFDRANGDATGAAQGSDGHGHH